MKISYALETKNSSNLKLTTYFEDVYEDGKDTSNGDGKDTLNEEDKNPLNEEDKDTPNEDIKKTSNVICTLLLTEKKETEDSVQINAPIPINTNLFDFLNNPTTKFIFTIVDLNENDMFYSKASYINSIGASLSKLGEEFIVSVENESSSLIINSEGKILEAVGYGKFSSMELYNRGLNKFKEIGQVNNNQ